MRLWIVIPVYGNWEDTLEILGCLERQECRDFAVVISDDGSPEAPPDAVRAYGWVHSIRFPNGGFSRACNRGAAYALAKGATHLLFLNSDTTVEPHFVAAARRAAEAHGGALVSPEIYWHHDPERIWYSGGPLTLLRLFSRQTRHFARAARVELVCGCALLAGAAEWRRLRGFDESFAFYFEDFDLAVRATRAGIPLMVEPEPAFRVWHKVSRSFRGDGAWRQQYHLVASRLQFAHRHLAAAEVAGVFALTFVHLAGVLILNVLRLPRPALLWRAFRRGFADAPPALMADFEKAGLLAVRDGRVLLCRKKHTTALLILPGGVIEPGESWEECLRREVAEELAGVTLGVVERLGRYESPAAVEGKTVAVELFAGELAGEPRAASEIKELVWFGAEDAAGLLAPSLRETIFPDLARRGLLPPGFGALQ